METESGETQISDTQGSDTHTEERHRGGTKTGHKENTEKGPPKAETHTQRERETHHLRGM